MSSHLAEQSVGGGGGQGLSGLSAGAPAWGSLHPCWQRDLFQPAYQLLESSVMLERVAS